MMGLSDAVTTSVAATVVRPAADAHRRGQEEELLMLRLALGKFSGHPRSTRIEIEDFIDKHNRYLKLTDENDRRAQAHVALYLVKTAAVWFRNLCKERQPHNVAFPRKEIFAAIRDRFCPKNDVEMIRDRLDNLRYNNAVYEECIVTLSFLEETVPPMDLTIWYIKGLRRSKNIHGKEIGRYVIDKLCDRNLFGGQSPAFAAYKTEIDLAMAAAQSMCTTLRIGEEDMESSEEDEESSEEDEEPQKRPAEDDEKADARPSKRRSK
ncbi:hypothetical protein BDZ88DRAFT_313188 [Geranomyces variabilis]|nr:hypothetical protein BDZ88DRAFT_313188 [Geranomyces variabilis]KAJ3131424.1 hypothetical protein HDU90_008298 [Geranomyces variabilis]